MRPNRRTFVLVALAFVGGMLLVWTVRTPGNLTVEITLDVGTWSKSLTGSLTVHGVGFGATLRLPVSKQALEGMQYRIGDAAHWQKLVDNMAAIEAAAGPAPEWFKPSEGPD